MLKKRVAVTVDFLLVQVEVKVNMKSILINKLRFMSA